VADTVVIKMAPDGSLPVVCPAAEALAAVRRSRRMEGAGKQVRAEVPGVLCRIVHEPLDPISDPRSPGAFCCNPHAGYRRCPIWQYDKTLIAHGFKSMGDESVMEDEVQATIREDMTGSRYGDMSWLDDMERSAQDAVAQLTDPRSDGMVRVQPGADE
jgi:hypothetical protein